MRKIFIRTQSTSINFDLTSLQFFIWWNVKLLIVIRSLSRRFDDARSSMHGVSYQVIHNVYPQMKVEKKSFLRNDFWEWKITEEENFDATADCDIFVSDFFSAHCHLVASIAVAAANKKEQVRK